MRFASVERVELGNVMDPCGGLVGARGTWTLCRFGGWRMHACHLSYMGVHGTIHKLVATSGQPLMTDVFPDRTYLFEFSAISCDL